MMVVEIAALQFRVIYNPGRHNIADVLSRLPVASPKQYRNPAEDYVNFVVQSCVPKTLSLKQIQQESKIDDEIQSILEAIRLNDWSKVNNPAFKSVKEELFIAENILMRGNRIVMPQFLNSEFSP